MCRQHSAFQIVLMNRHVEVKAVGARAEPALFYTEVKVPDAVKAAEKEQEKIRELQENKAARLKQFQEDVRKRVRQMNKAKHLKQLEIDYQAMERQHEMVRQSLRASDVLTERKDRVVQDQTLQQSFARNISLSIGGEPEAQVKVFDRHNKQVHTYTKEARQKLSSKKVESGIEDLEEIHPEGRRLSSPATKKVGKEGCAYASSKHVDFSDGFGADVRIDGVDRYSTFPSRSHRAHVIEAAEKENEEDSEMDEDRLREVKGEDEETDEDEYRAREQRVKFNSRTIEYSPLVTKQKTRKKGSRSRVRPPSAPSMPDLRSGATELADRRREELQKLSFRRLYSDLERQAVRDAERRRKQQFQIQQIKKEKEEQRTIEEEKARRLVEGRDPVTRETQLETSLRHELERSHLEETMHERQEQRQKQREMTRYLNALRSNLRDKLHQQGQELPSLCCCGDTVWDTHPDTCANNCFYYKNHRAYARALQSLLNSSDIL